MAKGERVAAWWLKARSWIVGLSAVLVVLPSLINGGIDVYKALLNIPRTDAQRANAELFRKYFNKPPVTVFPVPIKHSMGIVEAKFSIYEEGDVFIEYGNLSQWFPFPQAARISASVLIPSALAQDGASPRGIGAYQQKDKVEGGTISRERTYENGVVEKQRIDPRTGRIEERTTSRASASSKPHLAPFGVVDLEAKKAPQGKATAKSCASDLGTCALVSPVAGGSRCFCYTGSALVPGLAK
jgi:hypothetical protein